MHNAGLTALQANVPTVQFDTGVIQLTGASTDRSLLEVNSQHTFATLEQQQALQLFQAFGPKIITVTAEQL